MPTPVYTHAFIYSNKAHTHINTHTHIHTYIQSDQTPRAAARTDYTNKSHTHIHTYVHTVPPDPSSSSTHSLEQQVTYTHTYTHTYIHTYSPRAAARTDYTNKSHAHIHTYTHTNIQSHQTPRAASRTDYANKSNFRTPAARIRSEVESVNTGGSRIHGEWTPAAHRQLPADKPNTLDNIVKTYLRCVNVCVCVCVYCCVYCGV
jgi:hypothetical protein